VERHYGNVVAIAPVSWTNGRYTKTNSNEVFSASLVPKRRRIRSSPNEYGPLYCLYCRDRHCEGRRPADVIGAGKIATGMIAYQRH
jgi:hypothetical protein